MASGTFGTAINCMDGRVQEPVTAWVRQHFSVQYVDMITEAGTDGIIAHGESPLVHGIQHRVLISVNGHGSRVIAVVGHEDCAGNPVTNEQHRADVMSAMRMAASWHLPVQIVGLFIDASGNVEVVGQMEPSAS